MRKSIFKLSVILLLTFIVSYTQAQTLEINFASATTSQMEGNAKAALTGLSALTVSGKNLTDAMTVYVLLAPGDTNPVDVDDIVTRDILRSSFIPVTITAQDYTTASTIAIPNDGLQVLGDDIHEESETIKLSLLNPALYSFNSLGTRVETHLGVSHVINSNFTDFESISFDILDTRDIEAVKDRRYRFMLKKSDFKGAGSVKSFNEVKFLVDHPQGSYATIATYEVKTDGTYKFALRVMHDGDKAGGISNVAIKRTEAVESERTYQSSTQPTSVHTITNDDDPPAFFIRLERVSGENVMEGENVMAQFRAVLYKGDSPAQSTDTDLPADGYTLTYRISGDVTTSDYTSSTSIDIGSTEVSKVIDIPITNDRIIEEDETLILELVRTGINKVVVSPMEEHKIKSVVIKSMNTFTVELLRTSFPEDETSANVPTIRVSGLNVKDNTEIFSIQVIATDGTAKSVGTTPDYEIVGGFSGVPFSFIIPHMDYTMEENQIIKIPRIKTVEDKIAEADKTFTLLLLSSDMPNNRFILPTTPTTITITDNDKMPDLGGLNVSFTSATTSQTEGDTMNLSITGLSGITVTNGASLTEATTIYVLGALDTDRPGDDANFTLYPIPVMLNPGVSTIEMSYASLRYNGDTTYGGDREINFTLLNPSKYFLYAMGNVIGTVDAPKRIKTTLSDFEYVSFNAFDNLEDTRNEQQLNEYFKIDKSMFNIHGVYSASIAKRFAYGSDLIYALEVTYTPHTTPLTFSIKISDRCNNGGFSNLIIKGATGLSGFASTTPATVHTITENEALPNIIAKLENVPTKTSVTESTTATKIEFKVKLYKADGTTIVPTSELTTAYNIRILLSGTATLGQDYTGDGLTSASGGGWLLNVAAMENEKTLSFTILDDDLIETDETLTVIIVSGGTYPPSGIFSEVSKTAIIKSDDQLTASISDIVDSKLNITVTGGDASSYNEAIPLQVTVTGGTASRTGEDADYTFIAGGFNEAFTVNIPPANYTEVANQIVEIPFIRINKNKVFTSDKTIIMSAMTSSPALSLSSDPYTYTYTIALDVPLSAFTINFADATTSQVEGNSDAAASGISALNISGENLTTAKTVYILAEPGDTNPVEVDDITYRDIVSSVVIPVTMPVKDYRVEANQELSIESMASQLRIIGDARDESNETIKLSLLKPSENVFYSIGEVTSTVAGAHIVKTDLTDFTSLSFEVTDINLSTRRRRVMVNKVDFTNGYYIDNDIEITSNIIYSLTVTYIKIDGFYQFSILVKDEVYSPNQGFTNLVIKGSTGVNDFMSTQQPTSVHTLTDDDDSPPLNVRLEVVDPSVNENDMNAKAQFRMKVYKQDGSEATIAETFETTVSYRLSGTATKGTDYTNFATTSTIPAGTVSKIIDIPIISDPISEGDETIIVTLIGASPAAVGLSTTAFTQTVTISDNVPGQFYVKLETVTTGDVSESATPAIAQFRVKVYKTADNMSATATDLTDAGLTAGFDVTYTISGDVSDTDYTTPDSKTVTLVAGELEKTFSITIRNDTEVERDESLTVTLGAPSSLAVILSTSPADNTKSVTITSEDAYTIKLETVTVGDTIAEKPIDSAVPNKAEFKAVLFDGMSKVTASILNEPVTITYTVTGTAREGIDFSEITTKTVSLPTGNIEASIEVTLLDDNLIEDNETVIVTLTAPASTDTSAKARISATEAEIKQTVTVTSEDKLTVSIENQSVAEGNVNHDESININVTGADLTGYTTPAVTVMVTIENGTGTNAAMSPTHYSVNSSTGTTRAVGTAFPLTILPKDYTQTANQTISIADVVNIKGNELKEGNKEFSVRLSGATPTAIAEVESSKSTATYTINDDDGDLYVKLTKVTTGDVAENPTDPAVPNKAQFKIEVYKKNNNSKAVASEVTSAFAVTYTITGTVTVGEDYTDTTTKTVNFATGDIDKEINVTVLDDDKVEANETLMLTITKTNASGVSVSATPEDLSKSITITSEDFYTIKLEKVTVSDSIAENDADAKAQFKAVLYEGTAKATASVLPDPLTITYTVAGTAAEGEDYTSLPEKLVSLATNSLEQPIDIMLINDNRIEDDETIIVTLTGPAAADTTAKARISTTEAENTQTVTVTSEDKLTISVENQSVAEGNENHDAPVKIKVAGADLTGYTTPKVTVMVTVADGTGTNAATSPGDYTLNVPTGTTREVGTAFSFTIPEADYTQESLQSIAVATVNIKGNAVVAESKQFTVSVASPAPAPITMLGTNSAAYTISNDDSSLYVKLEKISGDKISEKATGTDPNLAQFRIKVYKATDDTAAVGADVTTAFEVTYTIAGTTRAGEDYTDINQKTVAFAIGDFEKNIDITVLDDLAIEGDETLTINLQRISGTAVGLSKTNADIEKSVTITSDETYVLKLVKVTSGDINENATDAKAQFKVDLYLGEVRLSAGGSNLPKTPITVTYTLSGTATAGSDYTEPATKQVTINTGRVDQALDIAILDDNEREENETLIMTLVSTTGNATKISDNSEEITQSYTIVSDEVVLGIPQEWLTDSKSIDTSVPSQVLSLSGENNALQIAGLAETNKVFIYNRIGELVWNTEDYPQGGVLNAHSDKYFRGISNIHGNTLPTDTYFMVIENYLPSGTKVTSHIIVIIE